MKRLLLPAVFAAEFLVTRLVSLAALPVFLDEAIHLDRAFRRPGSTGGADAC